jgi:myo-inositol-1-phosphate synthase
MLVQHHHAHEVIERCEVIKQDMFLYMSFEAAEEMFENVEQIQDISINHNKWKPFQTSTHFNEANDEPLHNKSEAVLKHSKRSNESTLPNYTITAYAQTVLNTVTTAMNIIPQPKHQEGRPHSVLLQNQSSDEMQFVRQQLLELKTKQQ